MEEVLGARQDVAAVLIEPVMGSGMIDTDAVPRRLARSRHDSASS